MTTQPSFVIRQFIEGNMRQEIPSDETDIFATGLVNSLFAMQLVLFVEQAFQITIESDDLVLDNFRSVVAIAEFVERKRSTTPVPSAVAIR